MSRVISTRDLWACPWSALVRLARALGLRVDDQGETPRARMRLVEAVARALAVDEVRESGAWRPAAREPAPSEPTAAERWRAVPVEARRVVLRWIERGQAQAHRDHVDAFHALLELAREAEGGGV